MPASVAQSIAVSAGQTAAAPPACGATSAVPPRARRTVRLSRCASSHQPTTITSQLLDCRVAAAKFERRRQFHRAPARHCDCPVAPQIEWLSRLRIRGAKDALAGAASAIVLTRASSIKLAQWAPVRLPILPLVNQPRKGENSEHKVSAHTTYRARASDRSSGGAARAASAHICEPSEHMKTLSAHEYRKGFSARGPAKVTAFGHCPSSEIGQLCHGRRRASSRPQRRCCRQRGRSARHSSPRHIRPRVKSCTSTLLQTMDAFIRSSNCKPQKVWPIGVARLVGLANRESRLTVVSQSSV
eukprot:scaffold70971_cov74-Phaeocystis_antarctica.AAC.6